MNIVLSANMSPRVRMCACSNTGAHLDLVRIDVAVGSEGDVSKDTGDVDPKQTLTATKRRRQVGPVNKIRVVTFPTRMVE